MTERVWKPGDIMEGVAIHPETLVELRALRLWHWKECLANREIAQDARGAGSAFARDSAEFSRRANFHLKAVQTLNDFFPAGDTAEGDAAPVQPVAAAVPAPPWLTSIANVAVNAKREGWYAYFSGKDREACPFPKDRDDLQKAYRFGWDAAKDAAGK